MPASPPRSTSHSAVSTEFTPMIGVGASDLQHAVAAEVERILKETKGDVLGQHKLLIGMLRERSLITDSEARALIRVAKVGHEAGAGKKSAKEGYFESRDLSNKLLASPEASPVALVLASSAVGSYEITEDPGGGGGVVFAKSSNDWQDRGALIGGLIGARLGGAGGAAIGAAIGGAVGHAVDKCLD